MVAMISMVKKLWNNLGDTEYHHSSSNHVAQGGNFQFWRERVFNIIFLTITIAGFFIIVPSVFLSIKSNLWIVAVVDTVLYLLIVAIIVFRKIPFKIRVLIGLAIIYSLGLLLFMIIGPIGPGPIWLFTFPVLTGVLLGAGPALISMLVNACTFVFIGIFIYTGQVGWNTVVTYTLNYWIVESLNFLLLDTIISLSLAALFNGIRKSLEREEAISTKLNIEHQKVLETNEMLSQEIQERKLAEEEKSRLEGQLIQAQKIESIGTLAGGIAHDFNNILYPIIGFTELTLSEVPEESLAHENLKEIHIAAKRAKSLVKQLLRFSRMEAPGFEEVKVQEIIREALVLIRASIPSTIDIHQEIDENCGPVLGDATQIHQVIVNLCTNAHHAMEETGGHIEVILKEHNIVDEFSNNEIIKLNLTTDRYAALTIRDTGTGIESTVLERIFDPYFTTKEQGKGTGLGLSVVDGIIKSHGGDIQVKSELGKGSEFRIIFPLVQESSEDIKSEYTEVHSNESGKILLVDDEEQILTMGRQMLERFGYHVEVCSSSLEALYLFRSKPDQFDLVITDMTMPNMTGLELARQLKEFKKEIPVLLCTGFSKSVSDKNLKDVGIAGFIVKPIEAKELKKMIRNVLGRTGK